MQHGDDNPDLAVYVMRFIVGAVLGLLLGVAEYRFIRGHNHYFVPILIGTALATAVSATIWGDKFLLWLLSSFRDRR